MKSKNKRLTPQTPTPNGQKNNPPPPEKSPETFLPLKSEATYRNFIENLPVMFYAAEQIEPYKPIYVSPAFAALGYPLDDWYNKSDMWIQTLHPQDRDWVLEQTKAAMQAGGEIDYEYRLVAKDGTVRWFRDRSCFIRNENGAIHWQGIILDISDRKAADRELEKRENLYRTFARHIPHTAVLIFDHDFRYTLADGEQLEKHGYTKEMFEGKTLWELFPTDVCAEWADYYRRALDGETISLEQQTDEGIFQTHVVPVRNESGKIFAGMVIWQDITERKRTEKAAKRSEERYRLLSEGIMHQVWMTTADGKLDYISRRTLEYFGRTAKQIITEGWKSVVHSEDLAECVKRWTHSFQTGECYETEFRLRRYDGVYRWHLARATAGLDPDGKIVNWFGTNTDIDDKKTAEDKLNHYALHDALTELPNRIEFMNQLKTAISRAESDERFRFAVLFLDLDRFKVINDSLGHGTGDKLLIGIARRLKAGVRPGDVVARLGGDEFTILLNETGSTAEVAKVAERLQEKLSKPFNFNNYEVFTSASIGIIVSDANHTEPEDFLRDADSAMYRAKESGKARYEIFDSAMHVRNVNLLQLETDLRYAVERNEFEVFYQPIVNLESGEVREFEALIRWRHPVRGLISPTEFICIAEETGLIIQIGEWILLESCRQIAEWRGLFPAFTSLSISVNLSAKQLMHPSLIAQVRNILRLTKLDPRYLKLEVTESTVMENSEIALRVLSELRALGISLSTDDFGTGYSSLSYLHRFPFQRIKIDRSFINRMDADIKSEAIVRSILMLGDNLEIETVAEGIENAEQLWQLRSLGCQIGQGYLFSPPTDAKAAEKILREGLPFCFATAEIPFNFSDMKKRFIELEEIQ